jgi:hypothetical protein
VTTPTCAHCGFRDSIGTTALDGRDVPTCGACLTKPRNFVGREHQQRLEIVERLGPISAGAVADQLGADDRPSRLRVSQFLNRLARDGAIEIDRSIRPFLYSAKRAA